MTALLEKVEMEVLNLPREERAFLADRLLSSLGDEALSDVDTAWVAEAEHRYAEYKSGTRQLPSRRSGSSNHAQRSEPPPKYLPRRHRGHYAAFRHQCQDLAFRRSRVQGLKSKVYSAPRLITVSTADSN